MNILTQTPKRNRSVARPPKLVHDAVRATTAPQSKVTPDKYFPTGRRWMRTEVGYSQNRYLDDMSLHDSFHIILIQRKAYPK